MSFLRRLGLAPVPKAVVLDANSFEQLGELDVGGMHGAIAADDAAVWITTWDDRALSRIDPATRAETLRVELPKKPRHLALGVTGPVVLCKDELVVRVDAATGTVAAQVELPEASDVVAAGSAVWVVRNAGDMPFEISLLQLDPATLATLREVPVGRSNISGGLRTGDGVVALLVEDPPGSMSEVVLDLATGERLPGDRAPQTKGIGERDGLRWAREGDRGFRVIELASGRELARGQASVPNVGDSALAHGCVWACAYREPSRGHRD